MTSAGVAVAVTGFDSSGRVVEEVKRGGPKGAECLELHRINNVRTKRGVYFVSLWASVLAAPAPANVVAVATKVIGSPCS